MKVKRPISLKMILTPTLRAQLTAEYKEVIRACELELDQLHFQSKKLLQESAKKGPEAQKIVSERIQKEENARKEKKARYQELLKQLSVLPDGSEIFHSQLEGEVEVNIGDSWDKLIGKAEIVVKDGMIVEIRDGVE